jgi:NAD(P)-dependent dehydrogenase (short-subunit alcohol dehydrogenase family)
MAPLLDGKVAIVSGVGPGLGIAICAALREHGAELVVGDLDAAAVERAASEHDAVGQVTDITDVDACAALVDLAVHTHGRVDVLVNDAYHGGDFTSFEDADLRARSPRSRTS